VSYLAFSVPALIAGVATTRFGLYSTALVYSASVAALAAAAAGTLLFRPGGKPTRAAPASHAVMPPGPCTAPRVRRPWNPAGGNPATTFESAGEPEVNALSPGAPRRPQGVLDASAREPITPAAAKEGVPDA